MPPFDTTRQATVIGLLRAGARRSEAAARAGVTPGTIRSLIKAGIGGDGLPMPDTFAEAVSDAEDEAIGTVESQLYAAAKEGQPWAVTMFLKGKARDEYGDKPATTNIQVNTLGVDGSAEDRIRTIAKMQAELDIRLALTAGSDIIEGEVSE